MKVIGGIAFGLGGLVLTAAGGLALRFHLGRRRADRVWAATRYPKLEDIGTVKNLAILPLIDRHVAREGLRGEAGVSYLVRAGDTTILFDVGLNGDREHPSPLLCNMEVLGVHLEEVDYVTQIIC